MASTSSAAPTSAQCAPCLAAVRAVLLLSSKFDLYASAVQCAQYLGFSLKFSMPSCPLPDFKAVGILNGADELRMRLVDKIQPQLASTSLGMW